MGLHRASNPFAAVLALAFALPAPLHAAELSLRARARPPVAQWAASAEHGDTATALLGLDGSSPETSARMTDALRAEIDARGMAGGRTASAAEVRIALDCASLDNACLSRASRLLGSPRIVFGTLEPHATGYTLRLDLFVASSDGGQIQTSTELPLAEADLQADRIDAVARRAADVLLPVEERTPFEEEAAPIDPVAEPRASAPARSSKRSDREYVWGSYSPRPNWKWVLFGTSTALMTISLAATLAVGIPVAQSSRRRGMLFDDLMAAARASVSDADPNNDVDPDRALDLCGSEAGSGGALEITGPTSGQSPSTPMSEWRGVRNATVAEQCQRGRTWERHTMRLAITTGVLALTTVATTMLLFVHKNPERTAQRRRFGIGAGPTVNGRGAFIGGSGRF